jgi:hypothetical protein
MKKPKLKGKAKAKAPEVTEDFDLFEIEDDLFDVGDESPADDRTINVKLSYNSTQISRTDTSSLIMECIELREIVAVKDMDMERAIKTCRANKHTPVGTLSFSDDLWFTYIYAREYVRIHGDKDHKDVAGSSYLSRPNPTWDETAENVAQDGRTLGGVDDEFGNLQPVEGDVGLAHVEGLFEIEATNPPPIREQVAKKEKEKIEKAKPKVAPATLPSKQLLEIQQQEDRIWELAQHYAEKPREEWEGKQDWMLEQKIRYCYDWLQEYGTAAPKPDDMVTIFWSRGDRLNMPRDNNSVRDKMVSEVLAYFRKAVAKKQGQINLKTKSYRKTLAAMHLQVSIDRYTAASVRQKMVTDQKTGDTTLAVDADKEYSDVKAAAKAYVQAHMPLSSLGAKPGPLSTLDPDYLGYIRLCRQYKLGRGLLLHEVEL